MSSVHQVPDLRKGGRHFWWCLPFLEELLVGRGRRHYFMSSLFAAAHNLRRRKTLLLMSSLLQVIGFEEEEDTFWMSSLSSSVGLWKGRKTLLIKFLLHQLSSTEFEVEEDLLHSQILVQNAPLYEKEEDSFYQKEEVIFDVSSLWLRGATNLFQLKVEVASSSSDWKREEILI